MNKGYWVAAYRSVSDESILKAYGKLAERAIAVNGERWDHSGPNRRRDRGARSWPQAAHGRRRIREL